MIREESIEMSYVQEQLWTKNNVKNKNQAEW